MKYYKLFFYLILTTIAQAQVDVSVETLSGYESNINKAPSTYILNTALINKDSTYQSSFYQDIAARLQYTQEWDNSRFRAYLTPEFRLFFSESNANQTVVNTRLNYRYNFENNIRWESNLRYKIKDRKGEDLDESELSVPLSYNIFNVETGLYFRMYKSNRTFVNILYDIKNFDDSDSRSTLYHRYGAEIEFKNVNWKNSLLHSYGVRAAYYKRDYDITYFSTGSSGDRTWTYLNLGIFYKLPISKEWSIIPALDYEKRTDVTNNRYGYSQIKPSIALQLKTDKFSGNISTSYTNRDFKTYMAKNSLKEEVELLNYKYFRVKAMVAYNFTNKLSLKSEVYMLDRKSNNTNVNTTAYRSYTNYYFGAGLKYTITAR